MHAYAAAKALLFKTPSLQWAIINHDDAYGHLMLEELPERTQTLTYGLKEGCDVRAISWKTTMSGSQIEIASPWGIHHIEVALLGKFNIYNSLAVFASLLANGFSVEEVIPVMKNLKASPGRMEVVSLRPCVIVDYAHSPDALENVLMTLGQLKQKRLGVVFGCGGDRDKTKRPMMGRIASLHADFVIVTSDNPRTEVPERIIDEIKAGLLSNHANTMTVIDRQEAIHQALSMADQEDIILIAGKGHESYQQIGKEKIHFSDQEVVQKWLVEN